MADEMRIQRNEEGDFVIRRDNQYGEVVVTPQHLIALAQSLPNLANELMQELHGSELSTSTSQLKSCSVRSDFISRSVFLRLTDARGIENTFELPLDHAEKLGRLLIETTLKIAISDPIANQ